MLEATAGDEYTSRDRGVAVGGRVVYAVGIDGSEEGLGVAHYGGAEEEASAVF